MKQRIITGIIAAAIFLPIVYYGNVPFLILMYAMASIGLYELLKMQKISVFSVPGVLSLLLLWIFLIPSNYDFFRESTTFSKVEIFLFGVLLFLIYSVVVKNRFSFDEVSKSILAIIYVGIGFYYMIETRMSESGLTLMFFALILIWATDSGAYFTGRSFGKHKLWPEISPKKTIEGSIGGIFYALLVAVCFYFFSDLPIPIIKLLLISVVLSVFGQLGDLVESAFKRHYGVKDSGNLLPGHGGILDRVDSWLFVFPLLYFFLSI